MLINIASPTLHTIRLVKMPTEYILYNAVTFFSRQTNCLSGGIFYPWKLKLTKSEGFFLPSKIAEIIKNLVLHNEQAFLLGMTVDLNIFKRLQFINVANIFYIIYLTRVLSK